MGVKEYCVNIFQPEIADNVRTYIVPACSSKEAICKVCTEMWADFVVGNDDGGLVTLKISVHSLDSIRAGWGHESILVGYSHC